MKSMSRELEIKSYKSKVVPEYQFVLSTPVPLTSSRVGGIGTFPYCHSPNSKLCRILYL